MGRLVAIAVLMLTTAGPYASEIDCDSLTVEGCFKAYEAAADGKSREKMKTLDAKIANERFTARRALSVSTSGDVPVSILGNEVSLNDLLPVFNITVDPGTSGDADENAGIVFEYSPTTLPRGDLKASVALREPELTSAFKDAIDDDELVSKLQDRARLFG